MTRADRVEGLELSYPEKVASVECRYPDAMAAVVNDDPFGLAPVQAGTAPVGGGVSLDAVSARPHRHQVWASSVARVLRAGWNVLTTAVILVGALAFVLYLVFAS
jgi:hypothetical protein